MWYWLKWVNIGWFFYMFELILVGIVRPKYGIVRHFYYLNVLSFLILWFIEIFNNIFK